ncbi:MAG TPA: sulfotransferase family protein [Pseudonocardiaceae bacterium]|nr:sulfotransferase family protein [Pseudonocardiaceae bacterium]
MHQIVALWSLPRSRSTAFFRMMAERGDFHVLHEPFSNRAEFGHTDVAGHLVDSERALLASIRSLAGRGPVFFKDTTDERYPGPLADVDFLARDAVHTFLIRHPRDTIASYHALNPHVRRHQIGVAHLHELYQRVTELTPCRPVVIDADDLVADPEATVRAYCDRIGIPYLPEALTWAPGDRVEWRSTARWHGDVRASTGFTADTGTHDVDVVDHPVLAGHLAHHLPFYQELHRHRLIPHPAR